MNEQIQPPAGTPLFNPWAPESIANPYPFYHRLRVTDPMHLTPLGLYVASRHPDVTEILRDKRFGKDFIGRMTRRSGPEILDEPVSQHEPSGRRCVSASPRRGHALCCEATSAGRSLPHIHQPANPGPTRKFSAGISTPCNQTSAPPKRCHVTSSQMR
jgi:hypothetical protein